MNYGRFALFAACLAAVLPGAAAAQNSNGELWEISSQMDMPGMPAGMGAQTQRVCQGDDPAARAKQDKERQECKVTDQKRTATQLSVTMTCPQGTMVIEQKYNAARTEFKGSMKFSGKDGDFTMLTSGRKVGACDVQQANREREAKVAAIQKQAAEGQAQAAAAQKKQNDQQIKECATAVESMQFARLGPYGQCYKKTDKDCKQTIEAMNQMSPQVAKACNANVAEFCKRYQTQEGFLKARADENAAQMCGVSTAAIKAAQCPRAATSESLGFLGAYCPEEAKPIAQQHCAGRDYTSKMGGKYARFCESYLANADFERSDRARAATPVTPASPAPNAGEQAADQVKEGINQGINKLRGLFGR